VKFLRKSFIGKSEVIFSLRFRSTVKFIFLRLRNGNSTKRMFSIKSHETEKDNAGIKTLLWLFGFFWRGNILPANLVDVPLILIWVGLVQELLENHLDKKQNDLRSARPKCFYRFARGEKLERINSHYK